MHPDGVDVVIDLINQFDALLGTARAVREGGALVSTLMGPEQLVFGDALAVRYIRLAPSAGDLAEVVRGVDEGWLVPHLSRTFPFARGAGGLCRAARRPCPRQNRGRGGPVRLRASSPADGGRARRRGRRLPTRRSSSRRTGSPPRRCPTRPRSTGPSAMRRPRSTACRIHFVTGGSGPVVLLLHGWPASWTYWRRVMPALAARPHGHLGRHAGVRILRQPRRPRTRSRSPHCCTS